MNQVVRHLILLCCLAGVVFFARLGAARLWDRDEPRNAGCAVEMIERGDWIVPVFNNELRVHKPVLLYWFMMSAYAVFGVNEFAARFWSAALAVGTVLMTYFIGRRLFNERVGLWSGAILATCVVFNLSARAATPDSTLVFFATLAMLIYVLGSDFSRDFFPKWPSAIAMYAAMGIATLAKGPVGFILPTAVIGMFLLIVRLPNDATPTDRATGLRRIGQILAAALRPFAPKHFVHTAESMRPITAIAVIALVALPWYIAVGVRTDGAWIRGFLFEHNVGRAMQPMEGHGGGPWFYPGALLIGSFPWVIILIPAIVSAFRWVHRNDPWWPGYALALCWVFVYLIVFTIPRTKLPTYITPIYPAVALLLGAYLHRWTNNEILPDPMRHRIAFGILAFVGIGITVAVAIAAERTLGGGQWLAVLGLIPFIGAVICWVLAEKQRRLQSAYALAATAALTVLAIFAVGAPTADKYQHSDKLLAAIRAQHPDPRVASFGRLEPSWVYYLGEPIQEIPKSEFDDAEAFVESGPDAFLITTADRLEQLRPSLSPDITTLVTVPYFAKDGDLIVLGRRSGARGASSGS